VYNFCLLFFPIPCSSRFFLALLLAVTWQIRDDTAALRKVDFLAARDIMKQWENFQKDLFNCNCNPSHNDEDRHYQTAMISMLSLDQLRSLKDHSRRAIHAVESAKDKLVAIGMLIHATYHYTICELNNLTNEEERQLQITWTAKLCAQQVYRQYIQDFDALHTAASHELNPRERGFFANEDKRRNILLQFACLTHMVYLLPPTTTTNNNNYDNEEPFPEFPNLEQAAKKIMTNVRAVGFASRLVAYPLDPHPPCYGTFRGHTSTVCDCQIFDDAGNFKCVSASSDSTVGVSKTHVHNIIIIICNQCDSVWGVNFVFSLNSLIGLSVCLYLVFPYLLCPSSNCGMSKPEFVIVAYRDMFKVSIVSLFCPKHNNVYQDRTINPCEYGVYQRASPSECWRDMLIGLHVVSSITMTRAFGSHRGHGIKRFGYGMPRRETAKWYFPVIPILSHRWLFPPWDGPYIVPVGIKPSRYGI
jgi:hypothetical protein